MTSVHRFVIETKLLQCFVAKAGDHDIGICQEFFKKRAPCFALQVDAEEVLVHRSKVERGVVDIGLFHAEAWAIRAVFVTGKRLDLVDGRAHLAQNARARGRRNVTGQLNDLNALKAFYLCSAFSGCHAFHQQLPFRCRSIRF